MSGKIALLSLRWRNFAIRAGTTRCRYGDQVPATPIDPAKPSPNYVDSIPVSDGAGLRSRTTFREHLLRIHDVANERDERVFTDEGA